MTPTATPPPIPLAYEGGVSRERLPDGSLRFTIVTGRSRLLVGITAGAGLCVAAAAVAFVLRPGAVPFRWVYMGFAALPLCLFGIIVTLMTPKQQTHVLEAGPAGLRVQTTVSGDRVDRFHPRDEIVSVKAVGMAINIKTTRDFYQSVPFGDRKVLKDVAAAINAELNAQHSGPNPGPSPERT